MINRTMFEGQIEVLKIENDQAIIKVNSVLLPMKAEELGVLSETPLPVTIAGSLFHSCYIDIERGRNVRVVGCLVMREGESLFLQAEHIEFKQQVGT